jgi:hypothetical protein
MEARARNLVPSASQSSWIKHEKLALQKRLVLQLRTKHFDVLFCRPWQWELPILNACIFCYVRWSVTEKINQIRCELRIKLRLHNSNTKQNKILWTTFCSTLPEAKFHSCPVNSSGDETWHPPYTFTLCAEGLWNNYLRVSLFWTCLVQGEQMLKTKKTGHVNHWCLIYNRRFHPYYFN